MWSGPRTVSTALMRSWENRPDTVVTDEPLYAFYLDRTGIDHPGRDEVIASQPTDWRVVLARLTSAPLPPGRRRRAARAGRTEPDLDDLGLRQQAEIFETFGGPVVDSRDLLTDPEGILRALCRVLDVRFDAGMLSWPPGPRDSDGVWASHWYASVRASTGFAAYRPPAEPLPARLEPLAERCLPYFLRLHRYRISSQAALCETGSRAQACGACASDPGASFRTGPASTGLAGPCERPVLAPRREPPRVSG